MVRTSKAAKAAPKAKREPKPKIYHDCACLTEIDKGKGVFATCGTQTLSTYAPGHDARTKGVLIRAHRAGEQVKVQVDGKVVTLDPMAAAESRGWERFLKYEVKPKPEPKPRKAAAPKAAKAAAKPRAPRKAKAPAADG